MICGRHGLTTGSCATAASLAAALQFQNEYVPNLCKIKLPTGITHSLLIESSGKNKENGWAQVIKDAGDDPDITHGARIRAEVTPSSTPGVTFRAGKGVGIVTRAGLQIPTGEPAINPVPRTMIAGHLLALRSGWVVEISIENGEFLARKTHNSRLGILGGLSVLGTTGLVHPFSHASQICSLRCALGLISAEQKERWVLVPGKMGVRAINSLFPGIPEHHIIEVGNDWGYALDFCKENPPKKLWVAGHPGKLVKLLHGARDTHSAKSNPAVHAVLAYLSIQWPTLYAKLISCATVEEILQKLDSFHRQILCNFMAAELAKKLLPYCSDHCRVWLTNMCGGIYGKSVAYA